MALNNGCIKQRLWERGVASSTELRVSPSDKCLQVCYGVPIKTAFPTFLHLETVQADIPTWEGVTLHSVTGWKSCSELQRSRGIGMFGSVAALSAAHCGFP